MRANAAYVETTHSAFYRLNIRKEVSDTSRSEALLRMTGKEIPGYKTASKFYGVEEAVHEIVNGYGFRLPRVVVPVGERSPSLVRPAPASPT